MIFAAITLEKSDTVMVWEILEAVTGDVLPVLADLCNQIFDPSLEM